MYDVTIAIQIVVLCEGEEEETMCISHNYIRKPTIASMCLDERKTNLW